MLEITVKDCRQIRALTLEILRMGDYLRYELHNCDIQNDRAYLFSRDLFPLAFLEVNVSKSGLAYTLLDSVESIDYVIPKLRTVRLEVDVAKKGLITSFDDAIERIRLKPDDKEEIAIDYGDEATKLLQLVYAVKELDPDIIVTSAGDSYLFPYLIQRATVNNVVDTFMLSRDNVPFKRKSSVGHDIFFLWTHVLSGRHHAAAWKNTHRRKQHLHHKRIRFRRLHRDSANLQSTPTHSSTVLNWLKHVVDTVLPSHKRRLLAASKQKNS